MERDKEVNDYLVSNGWVVLRFWSDEVKSALEDCIRAITSQLKSNHL